MQNLVSSSVEPTATHAASKSLRHALRYINRFGLKAGVQAARVRARSPEPLTVQLPGVTHPLWVRPGTSDVETFDEVFMAREYDVQLPDFAPRSILDLGANVGYTSVLFAVRWPEARILAVEPATDNMVLLKRNTGPYRGVTAIRAAVWSRPAEVAVTNPEAAANAYRMSDASGGAGEERIPAHTVGQLIERLGCARLNLLKMDVEGAEAEIFRGPLEWLDRVDVMVVELHDRIVPGCAAALYDALHGRHFQQEIVGQNLVIDLR